MVEIYRDIQEALEHGFERPRSNDPMGSGMQAPQEVQFPRDIEEEANSYFEKIYSKELSVKEMIDGLTRFKNSKNPREQEVFACMIHNLFDEYRFFPNYPDKELTLTAILFGSLIQYQLVAFYHLGTALRYVLEALRKPVGSKMFKFGLQALLQFQSRLGEWPQYCSHLIQITHLHQVFPDLIAYIRQILMSNPGAAAIKDGSVMSETMPNQEVIRKKPEDGLFSSISLDAFPEEMSLSKESPAPSEGIQDKLLFIVNNITDTNMGEKMKELTNLLKEEYQPWFSQYLVTKRAAVEPNYHPIYISLLFGLQRKAVERLVLYETFSSIKELVYSDKTVSSSSERTLLKNLGAWLGGITIARNKPILFKHISFRVRFPGIFAHVSLALL